MWSIKKRDTSKASPEPGGKIQTQRVLIITQHYYPEPNFITKDLAEYFSKSCQVSVITAHPNYPFGRFYDSVKTIWPTYSVESGVKIWRLPIFPDHSNSKIRRFFSYLSFSLIASVFTVFACKRPTTVFVYQTPFTVAICALWSKYMLRANLYFIYADLWPESFSAAGVAPAGWIMKLMYVYSRWINRRADFLICSTKGTRRRFILDGIPKQKSAFVPVWVDGLPTSYSIISERKKSSRSIVYAGNIGPAQGLDVLIAAAELCKLKNIDIRFDIFGTGVEEGKLKDLAEKRGLNNLFFHGRVSPQRAFEAAQNAMAVLVHLKASPLFRMTLPSKLSSSFAAGGLVLAGVEGEAEQWVRESGAGLTFRPENALNLVAHIETTLKMTAHEYLQINSRALDFYELNYKKERLLQFYEELFKTGRTEGIS